MPAQFLTPEIAEQMIADPRYKHRLKLVFEFFRGSVTKKQTWPR